jgi:hypothetical protein
MAIRLKRHRRFIAGSNAIHRNRSTPKMRGDKGRLKPLEYPTSLRFAKEEVRE